MAVTNGSLRLLSSPPKPDPTPNNVTKFPVCAEAVLIHGLNGSSENTWTKTNDTLGAAFLWARDAQQSERWQTIRFWSFSYDNNYTADFTPLAISLLSQLKQSFNGKLIILIAHSFGGLLLKEILRVSLERPEYAHIARYIRAAIFLGAPHTGSSFDEVLQPLCNLVFDDPSPHFDFLQKHIGSFEKINTTFRDLFSRRLSQQLRIVSFYELLETELQFVTQLIVSKEVATLGLNGEVVKSMNRNHENLSRYSGSTTPDFQSLSHQISVLLKRYGPWKHDMTQLSPMARKERLQHFFFQDVGSCVNFRDHLSQLVPGTCHWIKYHPVFSDWKSSTTDGPTFIWIHGPLGAGKTSLAAFIVDLLKQAPGHCHYHFFRAHNTSMSSLMSFVGSMAMQMGESFGIVMEHLLGQAFTTDRLGCHKLDAAWEALCLRGLRHIVDEGYKSMFWVIDGIDECESPELLIRWFCSLAQLRPLRIKVLVTCQWTPTIATIASTQPMMSERIDLDEVSDRIIDLQNFLYHSGIEGLSMEEVQRVESMACGNFLLAKYNLKLMRQYRDRKIASPLQEIYDGQWQTWRQMARHEKDRLTRDQLAALKHLLMWTVYSRFPMTVQQLSGVVYLRGCYDLDKEQFQRSCALWTRENEAFQVELSDDALRDFLTTQEDHPLHIAPSQSHEHLLKMCLSAMISAEILDSETFSISDSLYTYATKSWAFHLSHIESVVDPKILISLKELLNGPTIERWLCHLGPLDQLNLLLEASNALVCFRSTQLHLQNDSELNQIVSRWIIDFPQILAGFGGFMSLYPSQTINLVAPFCPPDSVLRQLSQRQNKNLISFVGTTERAWSDPIAQLDVPLNPSSIDCTGIHVAISSGSPPGLIIIYSADTIMESGRITHGYGVSKLRFSTDGTLLAAYSNEKLVVYEMVSLQPVWEWKLSSQDRSIRDLAFVQDDDAVLFCTVGGDVIKFSLPAGKREKLNKYDDGAMLQFPSRATFSRDGTMLAATYEKSPMVIWHVEEGTIRLDRCLDDRPQTGTVTRISWTPTSKRIMTTKSDGSAWIYDVIMGTKSELAPNGSGITFISCPPNELVYIGAKGSGQLKIWTAHDLRPVYYSKRHESTIGLVVCPNTSKIYNLQRKLCQVVMPNCLLHLSAKPKKTSLDQLLTMAQSHPDSAESDMIPDLDAMEVSLHGQLHCLAHSSDSLTIYDANGQALLSSVLSPFQPSVTALAWGSNDKRLAVADDLKDIRILDTTRLEANSFIEINCWPTATVVHQIIFSPNGVELMTISDYEICFGPNEDPSVQRSSIQAEESTRWLHHPEDEDLLIGLGKSKLFTIRWSDHQFRTYPLEYAGGNSYHHAGVTNIGIEAWSMARAKIFSSYSRRQILIWTPKDWASLGGLLFVLELSDLDCLLSGRSSLIRMNKAHGPVSERICYPLGFIKRISNDQLKETEVFAFLSKNRIIASWDERDTIRDHSVLPPWWCHPQSLQLAQVKRDGALLIPVVRRVIIIWRMFRIDL
ncbi:hypothetical protein BX600DRAFT_470218 [Xylariales sp. PMI_506]|nr:hypothetical protein BX600DRAFT_470218 [Xylariales sp. PMI_506]